MEQGDHWIETPQGQVFAASWTPVGASGLPIFLMHDSLGCVALWRDLPARLALRTGRKVIAYDRAGFGQSDPLSAPLPAPDFIAAEAHGTFDTVRTALGVDRFVMLGHSVGGCMAIAIAAAHRDRCDRLVTLSAPVFAEDRTRSGIRAAKVAFADPEQMARLGRYHGDKAEWVLAAWTETWLAPGFDRWSLDDAIAGLVCPVLVIHGAEDEYGSAVHPQRICDLNPSRAEVHVLEGVGHFPHRSDEAGVIERVAGFLDIAEAADP